MKLHKLQAAWDQFGQTNPMWAVLTSSKNWDPEAFFATGQQEVSELMKHIDSARAGLGRDRALDFGCGAGRLSQALSKYFDEVHGIDIAPSMIRTANEYNRVGNKCTYHLNPSNNLLLFPDNHFDLIYSNIVLQHIAPHFTLNYLREFMRVLSPKGLLVFQLPSKLVPNSRLKKLMFGLLPEPFWVSYRGVKQSLQDIYRRKPRMEMHGIEKSKVIAFLTGQGGNVIDVHRDLRPTSGQTDWEFYMYSVTKNG